MPRLPCRAAAWLGWLRLDRMLLALLALPALIVILLLPPSLHAQPARAYAVEIEGAGALAPLLEQNLEIVRHSRDAEISDEELQHLAAAAPQQIRELLATEGYFSPTVESDMSRRDGERVVRFRIAPGDPVTVESVDIRFAGHIAANLAADPAAAQRIARLRRQWSLKPGERFRQAAWDGAKSELLKGLLNRDYPGARIAASEARIDPERRTAQLSVNVDSGPAFTFGELQVHGLQRYSRELVDRLNPIHPGDPFSQDKLNELQLRLQDSGYFRSAFATIEVDPAKPSLVPVNVELNENQRRRLSLGIGFSTDAGARAQARWLDRRFLDRDWRLESELRVDRQSRLLGADVFFPPVSNGWIPSIGAHYERTDIANALNDKIRTSARLSSPEKHDEKIWAISYFADQQRIDELAPNNRQALLASWTYTRRRFDNDFMPRRGYMAGLELGAGVRGLLTERNLFRTVARGIWLIPFERRWQAVLRGEVGQVVGASRQRVPEDLLFRTGGDQTVRGYAYNTLGVPENGAIVGGTVFAVLSAELVYFVTPQWGAAVFTDAGNAAESWRDFRFQRGTGVGARWRSPIGPVNLDFAFAQATRQPRLHFSIGYAF